MTKDWTNFWQSYRLVNVKNDQDLLYQVGKTVGGEVIDPAQFDILVSEVVKRLELKKEDRLLDLCCGNGVLTYALSDYVKYVTGIDFSGPLIENARNFKSAENIRYYQKDIKELDPEYFYSSTAGINKILMYDALAYFSKSELIKILKSIVGICDWPVRILFASVLDKRKIWAFFNSPARKIQYIINKKILGNTRGVGKWWTPIELMKAGSIVDMRVQILNQDPSMFTAHYRLDAIFEKT